MAAPLKSDALEKGLSNAEAQRRLLEDGPNELSKNKKQTRFAIILEVLREPMFLLLLASSLIYLFLGDTYEALMLVGMILLVIGITFYQQAKTENALEALRSLSSPRALVIRDGKTCRIAGNEVVRGDWVILSEGDRVPADGILISGPGVSIDESLLTGESVSVRRNPDAGEASRLFSGTLIVQGQGVLKVQQTGMQTELGKIGRSLDTLGSENTLLQKEIRRFVVLFATWGGILCLSVFLIYGWVHHHWIEGLLAGITLAMTLLPEELPMVLTVFFALGAWRIAQKQVLTRQPRAIEALGSATVLCVDKTGTLTLNRMTVACVTNTQGELWIATGNPNSTPNPFSETFYYAALASQRQGVDPMDQAALEASKRYLPVETQQTMTSCELLKLYPITSKTMAMTQVWKSLSDDGTSLVIAIKGAPEKVMARCQLSLPRQKAILKQLQTMAQNGFRVLAVAKAHWHDEVTELPEDPEKISFEWVGLIGYQDPIRPEVPAAIQSCHQAGIRVIMMTGDYEETARSIARQIGLGHLDQMITGTQLANMSDDLLKEQVAETDVFARMLPEQKLRLVNALKANGEIVAMTGDGVNDAPALKASHIGIAMGKRGTDVAREAAHLVLLEDDFSSIVQAVGLGRRIFDNLRKAMGFIFSIHIPIAGISILPVVFNLPLVLFPAHVAFLEMIIDPACSIAFESEPSERDVMKRPPRPTLEPLFTRGSLFYSALQGNILLLAVFGVYGFSISQGYGEAEIRTMSFTTLVIANLMLITANLSGETPVIKMPFLKNRAYWLILASAFILLLLILTLPFLRDLFHFSPLSFGSYGVCFIAGLSSLLLLEILRILKKQRSNGKARFSSI